MDNENVFQMQYGTRFNYTQKLNHELYKQIKGRRKDHTELGTPDKKPKITFSFTSAVLGSKSIDICTQY